MEAVVVTKQKRLVPWIFSDGPKPGVAGLTDNQKKIIAEAARLNFRAIDWKNIELARGAFILCHWAKHNALEYKQVRKRLQIAASTSTKLLSALGDGRPRSPLSTNCRIDEIGLILWHQVEGPENLPFTAGLFPKLLELEKRAYAALDETARLSKTRFGRHHTAEANDH